MASGYLKVISYEAPELIESAREPLYELALTNHEVKCMFYKMVRDWFNRVKSDYNNFIKSLLADDIESMNEYMSELTLKVFSYFDTGSTNIRKASEISIMDLF